MPHEIYPMHILDKYRRRYAQMEEDIFRDYMGVLKPSGYMGPRKEKKLRLEAYAFTHIHMLANTMLDSRDYLDKAGMPDARKLFRNQLSDLEKTMNHALNGYLEKHITRRILWHEIGDIWGHANNDVEKLPLIRLGVQEEESMAA